jgi:hypothetical protein
MWSGSRRNSATSRASGSIRAGGIRYRFPDSR